MVYSIISPKAVIPKGQLSSALCGGNLFQPFCRGYFVNPNFATGTYQIRLPAIAQALTQLFTTVRLAQYDRSAVAVGKGRGDVIGEHNDYNWCKTFSFALDNGTICVAAARRKKLGEQGTISFVNTNQGFEPFLGLRVENIKIKERPARPEDIKWHFYPEACVGRLIEAYPQLREEMNQYHIVLAFDGNQEHGGVPISSGLSSSAAIEMATLIALANLFQEKLPKIERCQLGRLGSMAENDFANCGLLDQMTSIGPEGTQGVVLDYWEMMRNNWAGAFEFCDIPPNLLFFIVSSLAKGEAKIKSHTAEYGYRIRRLSDWVFAYNFFKNLQADANHREAAKRFLAQDNLRSRKPSMRDVYEYARQVHFNPLELWDQMVTRQTVLSYTGPEILSFMSGQNMGALFEELLNDSGLSQTAVEQMKGNVFKPAFGRYILGEHGRVLRFLEAMKNNWYGEMLELINETHWMMTGAYEAGNPKNDAIVDALRKSRVPGVASRIVGAGFENAWNIGLICSQNPEKLPQGWARVEQVLDEAGFNHHLLAPAGRGSAVMELPE
jgi:galactokinase